MINICAVEQVSDGEESLILETPRTHTRKNDNQWMSSRIAMRFAPRFSTDSLRLAVKHWPRAQGNPDALLFFVGGHGNGAVAPHWTGRRFVWIGIYTLPCATIASVPSASTGRRNTRCLDHSDYRSAPDDGNGHSDKGGHFLSSASTADDSGCWI